jgi:hypothetical protein
MILEVVAAALVAIVALWLVLEPLVGSGARLPRPYEPVDPEETPRGAALAALKEIDFDRETGKLSEGDYEFLKAKYTTLALEALRAESRVTPDAIEAMVAAKVRTLRSRTSAPLECSSCGPRPEPDAVFCSRCGRGLGQEQLSGSIIPSGSSRNSTAKPLSQNPLEAR